MQTNVCSEVKKLIHPRPYSRTRLSQLEFGNIKKDYKNNYRINKKAIL